jgi:hypothetical protein
VNPDELSIEMKKPSLEDTLRSVYNTTLAIGVAMSVALGGIVRAEAAESPRPAGPIGGTDIRQALLPPPGVYVVGVGVANDLFSYFGNSGSTQDASGSDLVGGAGVMAVYNVHPFGGSLASTFFASYDRMCFNLKGAFSQCSSGWNDAYSDVLMWSRFFPSSHFSPEPSPGSPFPIPYGLAVLAGFGVEIPLGTYRDDRIINNSANIWDFAPNVGLTYNTPSLLGPWFGQATEFSGRAWFNNYTENSATKYQTGKLISLDFAVSERLNGWQYGLAGTTLCQLQGDRRNGVEIGNRTSNLALGPIVSYDFMIGDRPFNATVKGLYSVYGTNTARAYGIILKLATKVF